MSEKEIFKDLIYEFLKVYSTIYIYSYIEYI